MGPQLSGFALGLLLGAAKMGFIGTIVFGIAWWRARAKVKYFESALPDPARLEERLASLEQATDYTVSRMNELLDAQQTILRQLGANAPRTALPESVAREGSEPPRTPH